MEWNELGYATTLCLKLCSMSFIAYIHIHTHIYTYMHTNFICHSRSIGGQLMADVDLLRFNQAILENK